MSKVKFKTGADASGMSLMGYITITHAELVKKLGQGEGASDKTLDEWSIEGSSNGETIIATIYDWKNYGRDVETITNWHIGGTSRKAVDLVHAIFNDKKVRHH